MAVLARYGLIALAVLAALAGIVGAVIHREHELVDQGRQEVKTAVAATQAEVKQQQAVQAQKTADQQLENRREAQRMEDRDLGGRRDADAALKRLQDVADRNRLAAAQAASAASASATGVVFNADVVSRGLYDQLVNRAIQLGRHAVDVAEYAKCLQRRGVECSQDYDALSP